MEQARQEYQHAAISRLISANVNVPETCAGSLTAEDYMANNEKHKNAIQEATSILEKATPNLSERGHWWTRSEICAGCKSLIKKYATSLESSREFTRTWQSSNIQDLQPTCKFCRLFQDCFRDCVQALDTTESVDFVELAFCFDHNKETRMEQLIIHGTGVLDSNSVEIVRHHPLRILPGEYSHITHLC
jgi:hypothetical protein